MSATATEPLSTSEWETLWHHLCARLAELKMSRSRLNAKVEGWGDESLALPIAELEHLVSAAYAHWQAPPALLKDSDA